VSLEREGKRDGRESISRWSHDEYFLLFAELRNRSKGLESIVRAVEVDLGGEMNCKDDVGS
jgi:hypothetical protein